MMAVGKLGNVEFLTTLRRGILAFRGHVADFVSCKLKEYGDKDKTSYARLDKSMMKAKELPGGSSHLIKFQSIENEIIEKMANHMQLKQMFRDAGEDAVSNVIVSNACETSNAIMEKSGQLQSSSDSLKFCINQVDVIRAECTKDDKKEKLKATNEQMKLTNVFTGRGEMGKRLAGWLREVHIVGNTGGHYPTSSYMPSQVAEGEADAYNLDTVMLSPMWWEGYAASPEPKGCLDVIT